ncbi:class I SAM-dependent methyltransferase [Sulfurimonas sp. HSL-1716]|uniref:class I SAM-dependent methyltransferase n=1 Tax=Hydrocurvibacter sulfurireducens TaxID=3131937 RepID=UPI0031F890DD
MPRIENEKFYKASLEKHGFTCRALHWNSERNQEIRFKILLSLLKEDITACRIVDVGCGFGDMYGYMKQKPLRYTGIDVMDEMVKEAKNRTGCEILKLDACTDELPHADYYLCSGAMNILQKFETYQFIRNCYGASEKGFLFNILEGEDESLVYNYFKEKEIRELARQLGAKIEIRKGYLQKDMSVGMYK